MSTGIQSLIAGLLEEQGRLQTPVTRVPSPGGPPDPNRFHRDLIPLTAPGAGEQYAFEVNLDQCTGCKACVAACHSLNGLDETEAWRDVGLINGFREDGSAYQQTVTTACHHCADPGCLNGCPVLAYEKDEATGIVRHLDDQCIGCQYCILKCPYDVPKYNKRLGIVRKCDMCHQRLAAGEAPACVQACPTHAIRIVNVPVDSTFNCTDTSQFLSVAPDPSLTEPTTRYVSNRPAPNRVAPADAGVPRVQPAHTPLAVMLVLTQLALGVEAASLFVTYYVTNGPVVDPVLSSAALGLLVAGLVASVAHLGQPLRAWRVFLGVRTSWLSREAVVFGLWLGGLATVTAMSWFLSSDGDIMRMLGLTALFFGFAGVACSIMVYGDTGRRAWSVPAVSWRFCSTVAVGMALVLGPEIAAPAVAAKVAIELFILSRSPWECTALVRGALNRAFRMRWFLGIVGSLLMASAIFEEGVLPVAVLFAVAGEFVERSLFFRAVDASRMPGVGSA